MNKRPVLLLLRVIAFVCAVAMLFLGYAMGRSGVNVLSRWRAISLPFAGIGLLWTIAALVLVTAALGIFISRAQQRLPLWAGGAALTVTGASIVIGVLTYVIPCSGPS